ncbi:MAG: hypothetical protein ABI818_12325 [Acidobacteriota bacterium]
MQVGVNYPWRDYGWDFGLAPPTWRAEPAEPTWHAEIDVDLQHLRSLGISVVRWFILADGLTYGQGPAAPQPDAVSGDLWHFDPPPLSAECQLHFEELLRRFAAANALGLPPIQLLPVLIDFHFCSPGIRPLAMRDPLDAAAVIPDPDWVKQGRADAINDPAKRQLFLDFALEPLLRISTDRREVIYAWEVINEPEWITNGWHPDQRLTHPVPEAPMRAFLEEGKERIRRAGFKPTIGFAMLDTIRRTGITAEINQFHHYPGGGRRLEPHTFDERFPGIVGEFATAGTDIWPELIGRKQSVLNRLRRAAAQGYPLAMPWSFGATDRHTSWTAAVETDLRTFAQLEGDAGPGNGV